MTQLIDNVWNLARIESEKYSSDNPNFVFNENQYGNFKEKFIEHYNTIKERYMQPSVKNLDRHKVSAIIIISLLESNAISYKNLEPGSVFIGAELLSLKVGLAYLIEKLSEKLQSKGIQQTINEFQFPNAQSCDTSYLEIMCRNLYYAKNNYTLNPLDLAERLFLLEYISLTKENIDPDILKDYE